jgi:hypothetical protein
MKAKLLMMLAGIALLAACKNSGKFSAADTVAITPNDSVKIVKTADMRLKVKNVQHVAEQVSKLVEDCGGMVMHHNMQSAIVDKQDILLSNDSIKKLTVYNTSADITIKIPSGIVEPFMDSLNHLSIYIDERKMDIEDRTLNYLAEKLKEQNRETSVALRSKIKLTQGGADSILMLKDNIVDKKIANLKTDDDVKYSTITLNLYQNNTVHTEVIANDDLNTYNNSLLTRIGMAFSKGWFFFSEMIVGLMHLWAFILATAITWIGIKVYKKKSKIAKPVS